MLFFQKWTTVGAKRTLKVKKSQNHFFLTSIPPKNERNLFCLLFFERNEGEKKCFEIFWPLTHGLQLRQQTAQKSLWVPFLLEYSNQQKRVKLVAKHITKEIQIIIWISLHITFTVSYEIINLLPVAWPKITNFFQQFAIKLLVPRLLSYSFIHSL